eukprot:CAMPEP_0170505458 /NCGR_PEP_ID=MMETSP0208-20121228/51023_1 /TAXON_ID=197538 /ORGANISM="Strombidium inclinatum, Strain S3" /LENGTH=76 /DNA_ID=CAMNT_0010786339 /DNA_START=1 /DNA_END=227 /DNA_ORIENTATION=-
MASAYATRDDDCAKSRTCYSKYNGTLFQTKSVSDVATKPSLKRMFRKLNYSKKARKYNRNKTAYKRAAREKAALEA